MTARAAHLAAALLLAVPAACLGVEKAYPEIRTYVLDAPRGGPADPALGGTVLVRRLSISPRCAGKAFVRTEDGARFESDYYAQFFVPPRDLVTEALRDWVEASGVFAHVVGTGSRVPHDFVLEGHVAALHADLGGGESEPRAILELQLVLLSEEGASVRIELECTVHEEEPLAEDTPPALVAAWNRALERALAAFEADLRGLAGSGEPPGGDALPGDGDRG